MERILTFLKNFTEDFLLLLNEMSPYLLLGLLFAGLLKVFLPASFIEKYLRKPNLKSVVNATILGIPLPLCSCGVLPTGIALHKNGASKGATTAFLTATPQTGIDSILVTYAMLGLPMAIIRPIVALLSGVFGGMATNRTTKKESIPKIKEENIKKQSENKPFTTKIVDVFTYAFNTFLSDIAKWLIIGTLIAAFISVAIPEDFFTTYVPKGPLGMILILIASVPLYICATASVPIAAILMGKGVSAGAILVFLMAGPATNAASFTLIGKTLGKKTLTAYLITIIICSIAFGLFIDYFLPEHWFTAHQITEMHSHKSPNFWFQTICSIILIGLILYIYIQKLISKKNPMKKIENATSFTVSDMNCNHCKISIEKAFNSHEKVTDIAVNLEQKTVQISGKISNDEVEKTLKDIGFSCQKSE